MSPRSLLLAVLLLAALAAAARPTEDVFMSVWLNMTPVRQCAADAPNRCFYIPRVDLNIDPTKTLAVVTYRCGWYVCAVMNPIGDYLLLNYIMTAAHRWYIVNITRPGLLYSPSPFRIGPAGTSSQVRATSYTACGKTYPYAYYVAAPGAYNITPLQPPFYIVDLDTCVEYRFVVRETAVVNITARWYSLYLAELNPPARKIYHSDAGSTKNAYVLNGTLHAYLTFFHHALRPQGSGFYIFQTSASVHVAQTLVMPYYHRSGYYNHRGPVAYDVWNNNNFPTKTGSPGVSYVAYTIGLPPGDGYLMAVLPGAGIVAPAELMYVSGNASQVGGAVGYFLIDVPVLTQGAGYIVYTRRYDVTHVAYADVSYAYDTRGVACTLRIDDVGVGWALNRLDRVYEIEICNNNTHATYVVFYYGSVNFVGDITGSVIYPGFQLYMYGDRVEPGNCTRLKWDGAVVSKPHLRVYTTPQGVCAASSNYTLSTTDYNPGWRYNLVGNSLVPVRPISPDYDYASQLLELLKWLSQLYRNLQGNFSRYLNATRGANATAFNLTDFFKSQPRFLGTIKMDSATSTWLRTMLSELQRWQVAAPAVGGAVSVSLQAPSALTASAAAAAVATAWAASRRSLATAAFLAGFAVLATALFTYYLYGATVSVSLVLAGVMLMTLGAAAAWFRRSED
jgi:hypothetical protein